MPKHVLAAVVSTALAFVLVPDASAQPLQRSIERIVERADLGTSAIVGVSIIDVGSGEVLAGLNAGEALIPASNLKLLTSGAALRSLGDDFVYRTQIQLAGDGSVVVIGSGDPTFGDAEALAAFDPPMTVEDVLGSIADGVIAAGAETVPSIVVDDRVFDRELVHEDWPRDQLHRHYCAPVSGLNFHTNTMAFFPIRPRAGGTTPDLQYEPSTSLLDVRVRAALKDAGRNTVWVRRDGPRTFTLLGNLRHTLQTPIRVPVEDPAMLFGELLGERLRQRGAVLSPDAVRLADESEQIEPGTTVAEISTPITDVLARCNEDSQNMYAEALLKTTAHATTGARGGWASGTAVLRMMLSDAVGAQDAADVVLRDGSGLSKENRIPARTLAKWLVVLASDESAAEPFIGSLPSPGEGTLRRRFRSTDLDNVVYAKSGTVAGVRCLSGYVVDPQSDRTIAFSVLVNGLKSGPAVVKAKEIHEVIVDEIDDYLVSQGRRTVDHGG